MGSKAVKKNCKNKSNSKTDVKRLCFTKDRVALRDALKKRSSLLHDLYVGAIVAHNTKSIPNRINLSAHSVREIMHKLPGELIVEAERDGMHLKALAIDLKKIWNKTITKEYFQEEGGIDLDKFDIDQVKLFLISASNFFDKAESILAIKEELSLAIIQHLQRTSGLGNLSENNKAKQIAIWKQSWSYFVKTAHHDNKQIKSFVSKLERFEKLLLDLLRPRTFAKFKQIKRVINQADGDVSEQNVKDALDLICNDEEEKYFYKNISIDWLEPLKQAGIFKATPIIVQDKERGVSVFPDWPPTLFLKNVVQKYPAEVVNILLNLRPIKNSRVFEDLMPVIIDLPPNESTKLKKIIVGWFSDENHFRLFGEVSKLVSKLFANGYDDIALSISSRMFDIVEGRYKNKNCGIYAINEWDYGQAICRVEESIKNTSIKINFIKILCYKLKKSIEAELSKSLSAESYVDMSHVWRRSIEKNNYDGDDDIRDVLTHHIFAICKDLLNKNPRALDEITAMLFEFPYPMFGRIALSLCDSYCVNKKLIFSLLMNVRLATSDDSFHEYVIFLKNNFQKLSREDANNLMNFFVGLRFRDASENYQNYRRFRILYIIRDHLKGSALDLYNELSEIHNVDEKSAGYLFYEVVAREVTPVYSISTEELENLEISEAAQRIHDWQAPAEERYGEYTRGVSLAVESMIVSRAPEFTASLDLLKFKNSNFARAVISGYTKIIEGEYNISWEEVLKYCLWIVEQDSPLPEPEQDTDWQWRGAKEAVFWFIEKSFSTKKLSFGLRQNVWEVISVGLNTLSTYENDSENDDKNYHHAAINDSKGKALNLAMRYGVWVISNLGIKPIDSSRVNYPELFNILDFYVNSDNSRSKKIHALFGSWLYWLYMLDSDWVIEKYTFLFPKEEEKQGYLNAIWFSYLLYGNVSVDLLDVLEEQYIRSISELLDTAVDGYNLMERVVGHLASLYLAGALSLDSDLIKHLYDCASSNTRIEMINIMGRLLNKKSANMAVSFWEFRVNACNEIEDWSELVDFGWWVKSGILPIEWMLDQAIIVLDKSLNIDPAYMVVEEIGKHAALYPEKVVKIVSSIVNNRVNDHGMFMWDRYLHPIIPVLLDSKVRGEAEEVVHKLGALGLTEFEQYIARN